MAGAAFSCQHSFSLTQGAGRPDISDLTIATGFADQVYHKVEALPSAEACPPLFVKGNDPVGPYYTPRDRHGNPINILPVKPKTKDTCTQCGRCAKECPLEAIDPADAHNIVGKCMKCNRCVRHCPKGAKYFDDPNYLYHLAPQGAGAVPLIKKQTSCQKQKSRRFPLRRDFCSAMATGSPGSTPRRGRT